MSIFLKPVSAYVPGKGATDFFKAWAFPNKEVTESYEHFYHEEIAYTFCHGAALAGAPAFLFIKSHGAAKAMNSLVGGMYSSITRPMLVFVFEDSLGQSSDHPFVFRDRYKSMDVQILESDGEISFKTLDQAWQMSLQFHQPVFISLDVSKPYTTEGFKNNLIKLLETHHALESPAGSFDKNERALEKFLNPLMSPRYFNKLDKTPTIPESIPPVLQPSLNKYIPIVHTLKSLEWDWVTGDAGTSSLFALPPYRWTNVCTHMGSGLPLALGAKQAGWEKVLATAGDFSVISTLSLSLLESQRKKLPLDVVIFCNGFAAATGGQQVQINDVLSQIPEILKPRIFEAGFNVESLKSFFKTPLSKDASTRIAVLKV